MSSSSTTTSSKSKCRTCGEKLMDSGNFQLKILKAKRVPLKIQKLIKAGKLNESKKDVLKQTKFGRFLLKRADARNIIEITCGQCSSSCQIRTKKTLKRIAAHDDHPSSSMISPAVSQNSIISPYSTKRRKKRNKEINAGLIIPQTPTTELSVDKTENSMYEFKSDSPGTVKPIVPSSNKPVLSKEKEMDNLRKVLFNSKKKAQQRGPGVKTSLQDFLSSM